MQRVFVRSLLLFAALALAASWPRFAGADLAPEALTPAQLAARNATATIPSGTYGDLIRYGRSIINDTPKTVPKYIVADMNCSACHLNGGTKAKGGSYLGIFAKFPQWNDRAKRFITLEDRLSECFLNSMNGHPPSYTSREMIAMVAYISWLSRGAVVGVGFPDQEYPILTDLGTPNVSRGKPLYGTKCASCHMANGQGIQGTFPPLWGSHSFNDSAGMSHLNTMTSFIIVNMPLSAPGSLTKQEAVDISAYVLSQPRPKFDRTRDVIFPVEPAGFY